MGLRDLLAFLTTLPVGGGSLEGAARWFWASPLVGALVGLVSAGAAWAAYTGTGSAGVAAAVYLAAHVAITGGLHLDGVADVGDLLHSGLRGEEARRVMRDPRKGAGGVILVTIILLLQYAASEALLVQGLLTALALGHVYSYEAMYIGSLAYKPSPYKGLGRVFREEGTRPWMVAANAAITATITLAALTLGGDSVACEALASLAGGLAAGYLPVSRLGYANGDVLGYVQEASRALGLLGALLCHSV